MKDFQPSPQYANVLRERQKAARDQLLVLPSLPQDEEQKLIKIVEILDVFSTPAMAYYYKSYADYTNAIIHFPWYAAFVDFYSSAQEIEVALRWEGGNPPWFPPNSSYFTGALKERMQQAEHQQNQRRQDLYHQVQTVGIVEWLDNQKATMTNEYTIHLQAAGAPDVAGKVTEYSSTINSLISYLSPQQ